MKNKKYIIINFLHGNSPYLRTTELAVAVNNLLEKQGRDRCGIIIPLAYGKRQEEIMKTNFKSIIEQHPDELLFSKELGAIIHSIIYSGESYNQTLEHFLREYESTEKAAQELIARGFTVYTPDGKEVNINSKDIIMEINRCPQISFGISKSYFTGFDYISEVLRQGLKDNSLSIRNELLEKAIPLYDSIEDRQTLHFIAEPAIFSYLGNRPRKYETETLTPPNTNQLELLQDEIQDDVGKGIYVTITGVPGLEHLFKAVHDMGLTVYTHRPDLIPGSRKAFPGIITHPNIILHVARSGWGSVWLSLLTKTPFIALPYNERDDLEIYFNNISIEALGMAKLYIGQPIEELLKFGEEYKENAERIKNQLLEKYGTINGVEYTAKKIVNNYLGT